MFVPATLVRGGTSKCWLFDGRDVPSARAELEDLLVRVYDAGDAGQTDGVGGATPTTSKAAVVGPSAAPGVDLDYLFAQVGIGVRRVEWGSNCGNCATAIALWAVTRGVVHPRGDRTRVVLRNTNTGTVLEAVVDTPGGQIRYHGDRTVPGTRSGGVGVGLTFLDPAGTTTGTTLPSGKPADALPLDALPLDALPLDGRALGTRWVRTTLLDAGAPVALADAVALGATATETAARMASLVEPLRRLRRRAGVAMGLTTPDGPVTEAVPKVGIVGPPRDYVTALGEPVAAGDHDIAVRMLSMTAPHPAIGLTSAVGVAVANQIDGTLVHRFSTAPGGAVLRIGTPAGVVTVECAGSGTRGPARVTVARAARVLASAQISVPDLLAATPA